MVQICHHCKEQRYSSIYAFKRHVKTCWKNPDRPKIICEICGKKFSRTDNYNRHRLLHATGVGNSSTVVVDETVVQQYDVNEIPFNELFTITNSETCANSTDLTARECLFKIKFTTKGIMLSKTGRLYSLMQKLFDYISSATNFRDKDALVQVGIESTSLEYPITTGVHRSSEFQFDYLLDRLEAVSQSQRLWDVGDDGELSLSVFQMPLPRYGIGTGGKVHSSLIDPQFYVNTLLNRGIVTNCLVVAICLSNRDINNVRQVSRKRITLNFISQILKFPSTKLVSTMDFRNIGNIVATEMNRQLVIIDLSGNVLYSDKSATNKIFVVATGEHILACPNVVS